MFNKSNPVAVDRKIVLLVLGNDFFFDAKGALGRRFSKLEVIPLRLQLLFQAFALITLG